MAEGSLRLDSHGHHHHAASSGVPVSLRRLLLALALIVCFMAAEVIVGVLAGSLALIADAAHMLTDAAAIALSAVAVRLAARPAGGAMTFGWRRAEILAAQVNGATLLVLSVAIVYTAVGRLISPPHVDGWPMVAVAVAGVAVNGMATATLAGAGRGSLNVEGVYQHIVTDLYAFIGTAIAGVVILLSGFDRADAIASLLVAGLMGYAAYRLLAESGRIFLEAAPRGLDPQEIGHALAAWPGVVEVHDLHVWEVSSGFPALSAHVLVTAGADCHGIRRELEELLAGRFELRHTTLQVDHEGGGGELLKLEVGGQ
jgi:cobalt-zinc-cadmium efflux system protein